MLGKPINQIASAIENASAADGGAEREQSVRASSEGCQCGYIPGSVRSSTFCRASWSPRHKASPCDGGTFRRAASGNCGRSCAFPNACSYELAFAVVIGRASSRLPYAAPARAVADDSPVAVQKPGIRRNPMRPAKPCGLHVFQDIGEGHPPTSRVIPVGENPAQEGTALPLTPRSASRTSAPPPHCTPSFPSA